ncbi:MAG: DUF4145 domain-containing protein [Acidobacteriota bacterium]
MLRCPHCTVAFHDIWAEPHLQQDGKRNWNVRHTLCPSCRELTIELVVYTLQAGHNVRTLQIRIYPKASTRSPVAPEVPEPLSSDYTEACLVMPDSEKASAALSRRCLQMILRDKAGIKHGNLSDEIQQVIDSRQLPSQLSDAVDAVRVVGNFAAHPIKSTNTGAVIEVEPQEAEWLLDTLEALFDFYFVQPAILQKKRDALNQKLTDASKPPLK